MHFRNLTWLSLKKLQQPVTIEQELDNYIRNPKAHSYQQEQQNSQCRPQHINKIKQIKAERTFLKKINNNLQWQQLVEQKYSSPTQHLKTEASLKSYSDIKTNQKQYGQKVSNLQRQQEVSVPMLKRRYPPFFQDVYPLIEAKKRHRSLTFCGKKKIAPQLSSSILKKTQSRGFKVHQIKWRNRPIPVFNGTNQSQSTLNDN